MRILIISAFFPPQNSIASLRPYSWAKYWARAGHDVTVVTVAKQPTLSDTVLSFDGFDVLELPLPGLAWLWSKRDVPQFHEAAIARGGPLNRRRVGMHGVLDNVHKWVNSKQAKYGFAYGCRMPDPHDLWAFSVIRATQSVTWDLVVSTAGPYSVHAPAFALKQRGLARRWIADWRDLWVDNPSFPGLPGFRWLERWLERRWCSHADAVTTVSQPLADVLSEKYELKTHVIYNGFDADDYAMLPVERSFPDDGMVRIVYTGSIYAGRQDPSALFQAIAELNGNKGLRPDKLQVLFCGNNANVDDLAERFGVASYVTYLGFLPRAQALCMQRDADALLFLEFSSDKAKGILTGKLFEYLVAGPRVLSVGHQSDLSVDDLLQETGRGVSLGVDVVRIQQELSQLLSVSTSAHRHRVETRGIPAELIRYSRSFQAEQMLKIETLG